jgi:Lon protease-like protein
MADGVTIRVNFARPMPLFPLDRVILMPHGVHAVHIFEDRYVQMIEDVLDGAGQIAMGVFEGEAWKQQYHGSPPVRPAVCVSQIVQHARLPDGRYNVLLQGVCRATIVEEVPRGPVELDEAGPAEAPRLYREVMLEPTDIGEHDEDELSIHRERIAGLLESDPLTDLKDVEQVVQHVRDSDIPVTAILELVTLSFITDPEVRYRLLASEDAEQRARILEDEMESLARLLRRAQPQRFEDCPKGCWWN